MKVRPDKINLLIEEIERILDEISEIESTYADSIHQVHPSFQQSARNLIHYRALRTIDITSLQKNLGDLGLSRIARAEPHIMASLQNCRYILKALVDDEPLDHKPRNISIRKAQKILRTHTKDLLGYRSKGRRVRIMVTLPSEAAYNYELVHDLMESGMNTARINCAHDGPAEWKKMIDHVIKAKEKLKKNCRISMDLSGPKIRTGAIEQGPQVRRFRPLRNEFGQVIQPAMVLLVPELLEYNNNELPVEQSWMEQLKIGDKVIFTDTRSKQRSLTVKAIEKGKVLTTCLDTSYIKTGTILTIDGSQNSCEVKELPSLEQAILLKMGDHLRIIKEQIPGRPIQYDDEGMALEEAFISCTSPEIFDFVEVGEKILFDDGKITGVVKKANQREILVEIIHTKMTGSSLKADKGINLPETNLKMRGLTEKDREDLRFIVQHADVVNFSFVNSPQDVQELLLELEKLDALNKLGIILKIETQSAYNNLTDILLEGMKNYPLGVMIARGDLAIESGWENMARIQQEILSLCNAAHVPDVWATQVLETLAKKGIPSRSEITDAATALNAECVMLNKGPYIRKAVNLLDYILKSLSEYRDKHVKMTPVMEKANIVSSIDLKT
ncbi:pyruvate kinase [Fulvivirgaceae bacterium BMA10]|uniref:pyruvate kinase n=1 Tax=Splendidivirga corallicola TaxID=3051826 RepID=A0ABT8KYM6_9BACT|nr:pyruvate kinase [Fulvivirgaceae bacterium BMA10]